MCVCVCVWVCVCVCTCVCVCVCVAGCKSVYVYMCHFEGIRVVQWRCLVLCVYWLQRSPPTTGHFKFHPATLADIGRVLSILNVLCRALTFWTCFAELCRASTSSERALSCWTDIERALPCWTSLAELQRYYESFSDNQCSIVMNLRQSRYHGTFDVLIIGSVYTWLLWAYLSHVVTGCAIWFDNHGEHTFCMLLVFYICWLYRCFIVVT